MHAQVVFPGLERHRGHQRRHARHGARLPDGDRVLTAQPCGGEKRRPVHARRLACEVDAGPPVIGVVVVGRDRARRLASRERGLESHDRSGTLVGVIESGECQQTADMSLVPGAQRLQARLGAEVVVAVGETESALQQERVVGPLAVDAGLDRQPDESRRLVDPVAERIDVGADPPAQQAGQGGLVTHTVDAVEHRAERSNAVRFDRGLVQPGCAEVGELASGRSRGRRARVVEQDRDLAARQLVDLIAGAPAVPPFRDHGAPEPRPIGECEEVVAGRDAGVDARFHALRPHRVHRAAQEDQGQGAARGCQSMGDHARESTEDAIACRRLGPTGLDQFQT